MTTTRFIEAVRYATLALTYVVLRTIDHFNLGGEYGPAIKESIRSIQGKKA